jgi:hypothetical protein
MVPLGAPNLAGNKLYFITVTQNANICIEKKQMPIQIIFVGIKVSIFFQEPFLKDSSFSLSLVKKFASKSDNFKCRHFGLPNIIFKCEMC